MLILMVIHLTPNPPITYPFIYYCLLAPKEILPFVIIACFFFFPCFSFFLFFKMLLCACALVLFENDLQNVNTLDFEMVYYSLAWLSIYHKQSSHQNNSTRLRPIYSHSKSNCKSFSSS
eukprot:m.87998 g.87998  ORF g.87998 m.87998 type:complete len:119 (-) comp8798_c2_seq2:852-1208(-)